MLLLLDGFFDAVDAAPKKLRTSAAMQFVIVALLKSVVEKLDEALRLK